MNAWILFGIAIIAHELGHYFAYWKITGKRPKAYFNGIAFHIENKDGESKISLKNKIIIAFVGVFIGLFFVLGTGNIALIYLLASSFDICMAYSLLLVKKEYNLNWDTLIKDIPCERCKGLSNSSPLVQTSNSTSLTSAKQKGFNMGLEVQKSKISSPKLSPTEITSLNPDIKRNFGFCSKSRRNQ